MLYGVQPRFKQADISSRLKQEESSQQEAPASTRTALAKLRKKSLLLTAYLNCLFKANKYYVPLDKIDDFESGVGDAWKDASAKQFKPGFTVLTPERADERGCQLSVLLLPRNIGMLKHTNKNLEDAGVFGDEREPDVIRFSPVPLYNTFKECYMTVKTFEWALRVSKTLTLDMEPSLTLNIMYATDRCCSSARQTT